MKRLENFFLYRFLFVYKLVVKMYYICYILYFLMIFNFNIYMCINVGVKSVVFFEFYYWYYESSEGLVLDIGIKVRGYKFYYRFLLNVWVYMYFNIW